MPNFKKNTGYKMKGSSFYGHGSSSPAKVSDEDVRKAVADLEHIQMDFKMPGWAKAAGKIFTPIGLGGKNGDLAKGIGESVKGGKNGETKAPKVETEHKLTDEDYKLGDYGSSTSMQVK